MRTLYWERIKSVGKARCLSCFKIIKAGERETVFYSDIYKYNPKCYHESCITREKWDTLVKDKDIELLKYKEPEETIRLDSEEFVEYIEKNEKMEEI